MLLGLRAGNPAMPTKDRERDAGSITCSTEPGTGVLLTVEQKDTQDLYFKTCKPTKDGNYRSGVSQRSVCRHPCGGELSCVCARTCSARR